MRTSAVLLVLALTACPPPPVTVPDAGAPDAGPALSACARAHAVAEPLPAYDALLPCLRDVAAPASEQQQAVDAFVALVDGTVGFPLVGEGRVVFFYVASAAYDLKQERNAGPDFAADRRRPPLRVAGDFNGWSTTAAPLTAEARGVFHLALPLDPGTQRWGYKFIAHDGSGADTWFPDPHARRFDFDDHGRLTLVRGGPTRGHLERLGPVHATKLGNDRPLYVWLPPGYDQATALYPVLYMHDGQNLFDPGQPDSAPASWEADEAANAEVLAGHAAPFIIVGIPNDADRLAEYTPVTDTYGGQEVGGKGDDYADFVVHDVKPRVDQRFRTQADRAHTAVLGSSLGGVISYRLGLKYPEVFRYVGGMSSTFDWGEGLGHPTLPQQWAALGTAQGRDQVFYLDSGGGPGPSGTCPSDGPNDGNDNYCETLRMRDALVQLGVHTYPDDPNAFPLTPANIDLEHWVDPGAPHSETSWRTRVFRPMRLFFRP